MDRAGDQSERLGNRELFALPSIQIAAHELKAPLALIRQLSQGLSAGNYDPDQIEQLSHRIGLTSERALRLTADLTRATRLDDSLFACEPIDPLSVCQDAVSEIAPLYRARDRQLRLVRRQRSVPLVVAHRDLLRRIMVNFADNALNYAERDRPVEVSLSYRRDKDMIRLGVRDYGPGLSRDIRRHVKSNQLPAQLAYRPASSGLGLYIARQFADSMNAAIGVTAHRDGASFYVDVPRSVQLGLW